MNNKLKKHFPMIRDRKELINIIQHDKKLQAIFNEWEEEWQKEFLDFCTGIRGVKILYDSFFKEVMNPEYGSERLESFLSVILKRKVKIVRILPNDATRIAEESSLLITDIIVELEDGSLGNVEVQKIGYKFPGERSACYSADMLLRQYKRVRSKYKKAFSYNRIKDVYLIVIYEKSPKEFKAFPQDYFHYGRQKFNTGLELNLLQKFVMIPLDIFKKNRENKPIETLLDAWLTFLSTDKPERIIQLITAYPEFKPMYETLYHLSQNVEEIMGFFSEELRILDRNTVKLMIEEQQNEIEEKQREIKEQREILAGQRKEIREQQRVLEKQSEQIENQSEQIEKQSEQIENQSEQIKEQSEQIENQSEQIKEQSEQIENQSEQIKEQSEQIENQSEQIEKQSEQIENQSEQIKKQSEQIKKQSAQLGEQSEQIEKQSAQLGEQSEQIKKQSAQLEEQSAQIEALRQELEKLKKIPTS